MNRPATITHDRRPPLSATKVPEITALFWLVKVLTTGMGEAASDWLANDDLVLAAGVGLVGFAVAMVLQLRAPGYSAARYWFAVAMVAVFGTMAADGVHRVIGVPYAATTTFYIVALGLVFWLWHRTEGTLDVHSIVAGRRELFYWATVLATFALGTAAGDLTAFTLHLGYLTSVVVFALAIAVPALAYWRRWLAAVPAFWSAYVLTRPLGASLADWLGKPHALRGLGYGDGTVTLVATAVIVALVTCLVVTGRDRPGRPSVDAA
jgi:uncharacterized membrane-anchored protein